MKPGDLIAAMRRLVLRPSFVVEIHGGVARLDRGAAPAGLVVGFSDAAQDVGIDHGKIYGVKSGLGVTLEFSSDIPAHAHQRFRNVLGIYRHRIKGA